MTNEPFEDRVVLVDDKDNAVGTEEKLKAHQLAELHRAFSIFIVNGEGKMLLQRRAKTKYHSGGLWTNACCSHPRPQEPLEAAVHRRLKEELGFDCKLNEFSHFIYKAVLDKGLTEHEYDHIFIGTYEGKVDFNPDEVCEIAWKTVDTIEDEIEKCPDDFTEWFKIAFEKYADYFKKTQSESVNINQFLEETAPKIDETIEKYIPRSFTKDAAMFKVNPPMYSYTLEPLNRAIADPIWDMLDRGGKRWRPALFLLICEALGQKGDFCLDFSIIPEVIHNGTLVIDDIEDSSEVRRGKPCTYKIYQLDIAVNAGNAMYYLPLLPLMANKTEISAEMQRDVYEVYVQEMINLSMGQAMDIAWHRGIANADALSEEDYLQMCAYKTGTLARMAAKMAAVLSGAEPKLVEKLGRFAESIGVAFQMQDDILDLTGEEFAKSKGCVGGDISEGKRSLLVIYTLNLANPADKKRLIEILDMHTSDQKLRNEAIALMQKYGAMEYVKQTAEKMVTESWSQAEKLLPTPEAKEKLKAFAEFLIKRNK
jgi:geranylgeranyl diphosphate synthase, type I